MVELNLYTVCFLILVLLITLRLWKVFYDDKDRPNRYLLAKEFISRPDAEELEVSRFNSVCHTAYGSGGY